MFILKYKFMYIEYELALATLFAMIGAQKLSIVNDVKHNDRDKIESSYNQSQNKPVEHKDKLQNIMESISKYTKQLNEFTAKFRMN